MEFDYTVTTEKSFTEAVAAVEQETKKAGFRVLYIHDVATTLAEKNFQIEPFKNRRAGKLSGGMKQKLALCCALIHRPAVLFLDEPTTGVDAVSRKEFWEMLKRLKEQGITILVSTPYMDEATLCERIALIQNGKILSIDTPEKIISQYPKILFQIKAENMSGLLKDLRQYNEIDSCHAFGGYHHFSFTNEPEAEKLAKLNDYLSSCNHHNVEFAPTRPTIEDCFINLLN